MFADDSDNAGMGATDKPMAQPLAELKEPPTEPDKLAEKWAARIAASKKHWDKFHKRVKHNRKLVAGFDWSKDPTDKDFYTLRANLIHGSITAVLPNIYARNPEISVSQNHASSNLKLTCETIQKVTNVSLTRAKLKLRAKSAVRAALTTSFGALKVMFQKDITEDPVIRSRINDTQDNIQKIELLIAKIEDPIERSEKEVQQAELNELMRSLNENVEVTVAEGMVIDNVFTEHLLFDDTITEFFDYVDSDWIVQMIPMKRATAEATFKYKLNTATTYKGNDVAASKDDRRLASADKNDQTSDDDQICVYEIWDKVTQTVYTMADGCKFWLREPYSPPSVGERWYPFFLLPYQIVSGQFIAPSLVDLTEKLQDEHNSARNKFNDHRDLNVPGWMMSSDIKEKSIKRFADSQLGEITLVDTDGAPLHSVVIARPAPTIDPVMYDTSAVRSDWEQVTGLQDAARSTVVKAKTATEADIMQQALSGRVSEFRDQTEDWLQEISQYSAQILLFNLSVPQVERIMGPDITSSDGTIKKQYDWPELTRDEIFDMVSIQIRAGTTGAPDKLDSQETWIKLLPVLQPLIDKIYQLIGQGMDATVYIELLKETVARFDDKLDVEKFIFKPPPPVLPQAPISPVLPTSQLGA